MPSGDLDLYMAAAPLLQEVWNVPCAELAIELWQHAGMRALVLGWCARRLGFGRPGPAELKGGAWVARVVEAFEAHVDAGSGADIVMLFKACCGDLAPVSPAECHYRRRDSVRVHARCKARHARMRGADAAMASLFIRADGLYGLAREPDEQKAPASMVLLDARAAARVPGSLPRASQLFLSIKYYARLS